MSTRGEELARVQIEPRQHASRSCSRSRDPDRAAGTGTGTGTGSEGSAPSYFPHGSCTGVLAWIWDELHPTGTRRSPAQGVDWMIFGPSGGTLASRPRRPKSTAPAWRRRS